MGQPRMKAGLMSRSFKFLFQMAATCGGRMYWDFEVGLWHRPNSAAQQSSQLSGGQQTTSARSTPRSLVAACDPLQSSAGTAEQTKFRQVAGSRTDVRPNAVAVASSAG